MQTSKMALLIAGMGLALAVSGWIRYFLVYHDNSEAFTFITLGMLIFWVGYFYNWARQEEKRDTKRDNDNLDRIKKLEKRLDATVMKLMGLGQDHLDNQIMGTEQ